MYSIAVVLCLFALSKHIQITKLTSCEVVYSTDSAFLRENGKLQSTLPLRCVLIY